MKPWCLEQYNGNDPSEFNNRRISLGYTLKGLSEITGISHHRIQKFSAFRARATPNEVTTLAKALLVSESMLREWIVCT